MANHDNRHPLRRSRFRIEVSEDVLDHERILDAGDEQAGDDQLVYRFASPRLGEQAPQPQWDDIPAPVPELVFDQRLSW